MQISISGGLNVARVGGYTANALKAINKGLASGFTKSQPVFAKAGRDEMQAKLNIKKKTALNSWSAKIMPPAHGKPTAVQLKTKHRWLVIHDTGGPIKPYKGKFIFIPFKGMRRLTYARFQALLASGDLEIKNFGRNTILVFRTGKTPKGKKRKGKAIGQLVRLTRIKRRLNLQRAVEAQSNAVATLLSTDISAQLAALPPI